jgi:hypothetical protein
MVSIFQTVAGDDGRPDFIFGTGPIVGEVVSHAGMLLNDQGQIYAVIDGVPVSHIGGIPFDEHGRMCVSSNWMAQDVGPGAASYAANGNLVVSSIEDLIYMGVAMDSEFSGGVTLENSDAVFVVSVSNDTVEIGETAVFNVTLSGITVMPQQFAFSLDNITTNPSDLGTPTFSPGVTEAGGVLTVLAGLGGFTISVPTIP